jgi:hypothetical protein
VKMVLWEYQPQAELDDVPLDGDYGQDHGPNATVETEPTSDGSDVNDSESALIGISSFLGIFSN